RVMSIEWICGSRGLRRGVQTGPWELPVPWQRPRDRDTQRFRTLGERKQIRQHRGRSSCAFGPMRESLGQGCPLPWAPLSPNPWVPQSDRSPWVSEGFVEFSLRYGRPALLDNGSGAFFPPPATREYPLILIGVSRPRREGGSP